MPGTNILHATGCKIRVIGNGELKLKYQSLQNVSETDLVSIEMQNPTDRTKTRLGNFVNETIFLRGETTRKGEFMRINTITIFVTQIWADYPG